MNFRTPQRWLLPLVALSLVAASCGSNSDTTTDAAANESDPTTTTTAEAIESTTTEAIVADEPAESNAASSGATDSVDARTEALLGAQWADGVTITIDGDTVTFESDGLPSHEYLDVYLGDGRDGKFIAGGAEAYDPTHTFPLVPTEAAAPSDTGNGTIGVAISGAVFFNPYEGDGSETIANDDNTTIDGIPFIDACGGHPLPNATTYHYHGVPFCITDAIDTDGQHSEIIGYLFDGYPIYGPQDVDGEEPTDLDECMGHVGMTPDFDEPVYHYHVSTTANYISECYSGEATAQRRGR